MQCLTLDLNLQNRALSQYTNHTFNSMAEFNGNFFYTNNFGLFRETGTLDNASVISAYFELVKTDFGIKNPKRLRYVYLGIDTSVTLTMTITVDDTYSNTFDIVPTRIGQQRVRVPIDRTLRGRYWSINIAGPAPFAIDSIDVLPVILTEGHV